MTRTLAAIGVATIAVVTGAMAQSGAGTGVQSWQIREGIHMLVGPGAHTTVHVGRDGVLVVDPQTAAVSSQVLAAIRRLSDKPVRFIVDTTSDADHIGGNEGIAKSGQILGGGKHQAP